MTVKEIAQVTGKTEDTICRWIRKIVHLQNKGVDLQNEGVKSIALKAGSKDGHHPADYTKAETLFIIEIGLGTDAAKIYLQATKETEIAYQASKYHLTSRDIEIISLFTAEIVSKIIDNLNERLTRVENSLEGQKALLPIAQMGSKEQIRGLITEYAGKYGKKRIKSDKCGKTAIG
jgi:hypothetical protein